MPAARWGGGALLSVTLVCVRMLKPRENMARTGGISSM